MVTRIGHRQQGRGLADIDSNDDRGRRDWSYMHRHNNTSGACQEVHVRPTHGPRKGISYRSLPDTSGGI